MHEQLVREQVERVVELLGYWLVLRLVKAKIAKIVKAFGLND